MSRIAGSYASMSNEEQLAFTQQLREQRQRGAKVRGVRGKVEANGTQGNEAQGEQGAIEAQDSEGSGDT
jgi:hypothetical protein